MTSTKAPIDYQKIFEQMPVVRFLLDKVGDNYRFVEVNSSACRYLGLEKEEILGQTVDELFSLAGAQYMNASLDVCAQKKSPVTIPASPSFPGNMKISGFWVHPVFDGDDVQFLDVLAHPSAVDSSIIERERDDALLLLTSIFDASEVGILVFDRQRRIVKINDSFERIFGWDRKDTLGKDFVEFLPEDDQTAAQDNYKEFIKRGERTSGEAQIICKDGGMANTLYTTVSLELSHGRRFQVTTLVDITKRKQMEYSLRFAKDQADAANSAKSAFLANMSHELRTPLNAIIGFSEMIMTEAFGPLGHAKYNEYSADVHLSAKHLLEIINEVLDMSKIEAGRVELAEQDIDLEKLFSTVLRLFRSRLEQTNLRIKMSCEEGLPKLKADPRLLRQILINLITNSIKYSNKNGKIDLDVKMNNDGEVVMTVSDDGVGIPADQIQNAMEPFGQIHDPTKASIYQGTGLGLPLSKAMTELHGGRFRLQSVEGEGTTVIVIFPEKRVLN